MAVKIIVVSTGEEFPPDQMPQPDPSNCWEYDPLSYGPDRWGRILANHDWFPTGIGETSSTWYCRRCRRIERIEQ